MATRISGKLYKLFSRDFYAHRAYIAALSKPVDDCAVLLESSHGKGLGGNIAAILRYLCEDEACRGFSLYVSVAEGRESLARQWADFDGASRVRVLRTGSAAYFKKLATAKFLINDTSFPPVFVKRSGQLYLNTWHGTPLKTLGRATDSDRFTMGNLQKNFLSADLMLYPNEFTRDIMQRDYMLDNFGTGRIALTGYPRNEVFFSKETRTRIRRKYAPDGRRIFVYMPTWRGRMTSVTEEEQLAKLDEMFAVLDDNIDDETSIYVKYHSMLRTLTCGDRYKHIKQFPEDERTYDFLQGSDGLITDYSSVMFDYAVTGRPVILFTYDEDEYIRERGLYLSLDELPFVRTRSAAELAGLLAGTSRGSARGDSVDTAAGGADCPDPTAYAADDEFLDRFCAYDGPGVTAGLMRNFLSGNLSGYPLMPSNGRKNVVIYGGDFITNGIITALIALLKRLDPDRFNYMVLYQMSDDGHVENALSGIPLKLSELGCARINRATLWELITTKLWEKLQKLPFGPARRAYEAIGERDAAGIFGRARIDAAIQFTGYSPMYMHALSALGCGCALFVHNDMTRESKKSYAMPGREVASMYSAYDEVAVITPELSETTLEFMRKAHEPERIITVVPNPVDTERIRSLSREDICFDSGTEATACIDELRSIVKEHRTIINIGRFSPEKGQARLITAFENILGQYAAQGSPVDVYLILLGSYGQSYEELLNRRQVSEYADRIVIIKSMRNPYALLAACDYFVLSSYYEGLPMTLWEADILGVPCVSTYVGAGAGPFMKAHGGYVVEDSTGGVEDGIRACLEGRVAAKLNMDYDRHNEEAVRCFEALADRLTDVSREVKE